MSTLCISWRFELEFRATEMHRSTALLRAGSPRPRRCMSLVEWIGWIGLGLFVYYLCERMQEFEDIMPSGAADSNQVRHMSSPDTSTYRHIMRHAKHEDSSSKGIYKWFLEKFKIHTDTHIDGTQYRDSLVAVTTGKDYGNHGSFALPGSNNQAGADRVEEHDTFDKLVAKSKGDGRHVVDANVDVETENGERIEKQQQTLLDQFSVENTHSVEKFHSDADTPKPHIEHADGEDELHKMNVTIIDNKKNIEINVIRMRRRLRGRV